MKVKKQQLEPDMEQWTSSKLGKEYVKAVYCYSAYLTYMQTTSCKMLGWMKHKLESKLPRGGNIDNLRYADDTTLMAESEELKSLLVKEETEKSGLKLNVQKQRSWHLGSQHLMQIDGEKVEAVTDFIFLGSKITAEEDCIHDIKRHLILGRKAMSNLDSILKSRDITLPTKLHRVEAMVFQ